ncbi:glycosyltransferase family 2 protein [Litorimonas sp. WD9-15]|uniref:glycosyltransferase family 2 protein n=1 Tax=Litorimonas sp. WD9-15 TaxID=3418716 RepID=UPI003D05898B
MLSIVPRLSIIVIFHDMAREAKRTLATLSPEYQIGVSEYDYEVIAVDNGSSTPLTEEFVNGFGDNFTLIHYETDLPSPAMAVNVGVKHARAPYIALVVDGARMLSPGIVKASLDGLINVQLSTTIGARPLIAALAWHLGPDVQNLSMQTGYNQSVEDDLLSSIDWRQDGYRLFNISTLADSSVKGVGISFPTECSWVALGREHFLEVGGYDRRFVSPGGGLVNHEFIERVFNVPPVAPIILNDEGSFHQFHGGVATNVLPENHPWESFHQEYQSIIGKGYNPPPFPEPVLWETYERDAPEERARLAS